MGLPLLGAVGGGTGQPVTFSERAWGDCTYPGAVSDPLPAVTGEDQSVIPLFPLGTVLFPGVVLPLHIFEPRYRLLVRELMHPSNRPEFGVVAIRQGTETGQNGASELYGIGCAAALRQVTP